MEITTIVLGLALIVASGLLLVKYGAKRRRLVSLVDRLPGPRKYPLIGTALRFLTVPRHKFVNVAADLDENYAPIFRMWTGPSPEIHLTRAKAFEAILGGMKHTKKGWAYRFLHPWLGFGLLTSSGKKWQTHRKMITPTFHFKILELFSETFVVNSQTLVEKLQQEVDACGDEGFDIYPLITRCALDMICETAMGVKIRAQQEVHSDYVKAVCDISELTMYRGIRPWLYIDFLFKLTKAGKRYNECLEVLHGFTNKVIRERKLENQIRSEKKDVTSNEDQTLGAKRRIAFLDLLLEASQGDNSLTDEEIREEVDTFMFEGHDTTTAAISWTLFLIGSHPHVQEKVFDELDSIFHDSDRPITTRDCQEMKYLERVIKEALRLFPSVPFILRTIEGDTELDGYTLPDGVMVVLHIYMAHHSREHFPNPEQFDPDNFLPERVQGRHPYAYVPFSAGPRNCIGQKFAILEEKIVLATILRCYKIRSLQKREDILLYSDLILRPKNGIQMSFTRRVNQ